MAISKKPIMSSDVMESRIEKHFENGLALVRCNHPKDAKPAYELCDMMSSIKSNSSSIRLKPISAELFSSVDDFNEKGLAHCVRAVDGKHNAIRKDGSLLSDVWYDDMRLHPKCTLVRKGDRFNYLDGKGRPMLQEWAIEAEPFRGECAKFRFAYQQDRFMDKKGRIHKDPVLKSMNALQAACFTIRCGLPFKTGL